MKTSICLCVAAVVVWPALATDESASKVKTLRDLEIEDLLEVKAISAVRHDQKQLDSPRSMSIVTGEELRRKNFRTVPEALNELVGVMVQETNYGGGSPIIRGMVGNRILILIDGVRLNSGSYRLGPNQYLNTIDINQVERIEVVRGAGSVLYGTDALGGLINVITKTPKAAEGASAFSGELGTRFSTADRGISSGARFSGAWRNFAATGGFSGKHFGDLRAGRGVGRIASSGYEERDGDIKLSFTPSQRESITVAVARVHQDDVCRTDVVQSGANLEYCWNPIQRDLLQLRYRRDRVAPLVDWLEVRGRYETQLEALDTIATATPDARSHYFDRTNSRGLALEMGSHIGAKQLLTYGMDLDRDVMTSSREDYSALVGSHSAPGNVPNGSSYGTLAAFLQDEVQLLGPFALNLGGRYSRIAINGDLSDTRTGNLSIDNSLHDFTGSGYLSLRAGPQVRFLFGFSQGFRAPNLNDEGFLGISGSRFEIPNPALKPERNGTWESGVKFSSRKFVGTASYFLSNYRDLIDRATATFKGLPFLDLNGNGVKDKGEVNVYQRQNIGRARVIGGGMEGEWRLADACSVFGNVSWTRGDDTVNRTPLTRIPPVKGIFGHRWRGRRDMWVEGYTILAGAQRRLSPSDRADARIRPGGTPGFATLNVRGGIPVKGLGILTVGLENLTDKAYRWHGSGIEAPGINLVIGITHQLP